jgi:hypothetical protein
MPRTGSAEEKSRREEFQRWLLAVEGAAAGIVEVGEQLFKRGAPSDPALLRPYRLYKRLQAARTLPPGEVRVAMLHSMLVDAKPTN